MIGEFLPPGFKSLSTDQVARSLKDRGFKRDLEDQCAATLDTYPYVDLPDTPPVNTGVTLYAAGGLSPLSPEMKCVCAQCRFYFVDEFSRSAGLYADQIVLADEFTWTLSDLTPHSAFIETLVVARLKPLVKAGVVRFSRAAYARCQACKKHMEAAGRRAERALWQELQGSVDVFAFKWGRRYRLSFGSPRFPQIGDGMRMTVPTDAATARELGIGVIHRGKEARSLLQKSKLFLKRDLSSLAGRLTFDAAMSAYSNATIATNSEFTMLGLRAIDLRPLPVGRSWDPALLPTVPLPYLGGLSTVEVLEVRDKARRALPAFRARLQRDLMSASSDRDNDEKAFRLAAALRLEVAELEAELASLRLPLARRREGLLSVLSFLLTLAGLGTGNTEAVIAGGATLAGTLASVHQSLSERERRHSVVKSQPASVLLTAKHMHQPSTHHAGVDQG